jgi:hypothetical protein
MKFYLLQHYYKAGLLVPFYTSIGFGAIFLAIEYWALAPTLPQFLHHPITATFLSIPLYSGLIGVSALSIFLNNWERIACRYLYSVLCWFAPPLAFMAAWLYFHIDWSDPTASHNRLEHVPLFLITALHIIGLLISFMDFRASMNAFLREEKIKAGAVPASEQLVS